MIGLATLSAAGVASAFHYSPFLTNTQKKINIRTTNLKVAADPTLVTTKEFQDICGVDYSAEELDKRLQRTAYLYPKHVEVIEDLGPIVDEMVEDIVSNYTIPDISNDNDVILMLKQLVHKFNIILLVFINVPPNISRCIKI